MSADLRSPEFVCGLGLRYTQGSKICVSPNDSAVAVNVGPVALCDRVRMMVEEKMGVETRLDGKKRSLTNIPRISAVEGFSDVMVTFAVAAHWSILVLSFYIEQKIRTVEDPVLRP